MDEALMEFEKSLCVECALCSGERFVRKMTDGLYNDYICPACGGSGLARDDPWDKKLRPYKRRIE